MKRERNEEAWLSWQSPPPRGRGLKQKQRAARQSRLQVAPPAGAWIETRKIGPIPRLTLSPPRGGVD